MGERGLAGGGRARDHHEANALPGGNLVGDVADLLFHHGLVGENHLCGLPPGDDIVHLPYIGDVEYCGEVLSLVHGLKDLHGGLEVP